MAFNIFNSIKLPKPPVSRFDLSHDVKLSFNMGELVPTCVMECVPGDRFYISVENMLRFAPLVSPVMHRVNVTTHFYFVPNRILWSDFDKWITGDLEAEHPYFANGTFYTPGTLGDYLGIPQTSDNTIRFNAFPGAAYIKIWDEYYRDQNLQDPLFEPLVPGLNAWVGSYLNDPPLRRAWMHDYFTSCLPFAQKGDAVQIPLVNAQNIPVEYTANGEPGLIKDEAGNILTTGDLQVSAGPSPYAGSMHAGATPATYDPNGTLNVDVQAEATTINDLRTAVALQRFLEKSARAGTRYIEWLKGIFNVNSSDKRLQRPEYIGGAYQRMTISEVLATATAVDAEGTPLIPQGNMAGHGISVGSSKGFDYYCEEHGWIIGIINVQPVTAYSQGIHRSFSRFDRLDYYTPDFANIGEQAVLNKELYAVGTPTELDGVFGYNPRYSEYKYMNSRVAGEMKDSLIYWHLARTFNAMPALNADFISCSDDNTLNRIFAVTDPDVDKIYAHVFNNIAAVRKMPKYGIPAGL